MKRLLTLLALTCTAVSSFGATLVPVQLLNPTGSSAGQAIVSTGSSTAPAWGAVSATSLAAQAANTVVGNATGSTASPTAITVTGCNGAAQALQWTNGSGFGCNSSIATSGANTNITSLNAPALGAATATTASSTTNTTQVATTAMVNSAITGGSLGGSFTTLTGSSLAAVYVTKTSSQSIATATATTITGWAAATFDQTSSFNTSTGAFVAPATAYYWVSFIGTFSASMAAGTSVQAYILNNGANVLSNIVSVYGTGPSSWVISVNGLVKMTSGQSLTVQMYQNSGSSASTISGTPQLMNLSIKQIP